jgi:hypothetical protein
MISREEAKKKAQSRDCSCVLGKDRDNNYNECINEIYDTIGSCAECRMWTPYTKEGNAGECYIGNEDGAWFKHDYCSRFERKTNEPN